MYSKFNSGLIPGQFDVVGLGLNAMDYISILPHFPQPQAKVRISEVRLEPGGQVATALTTCARLGLKGCYIGSVGSDHLGNLQLESLRREGLDISSIRTVEGATSQIAFIILEEGIGERTILWHRDDRLIFPSEELPQEVILSGRLLHLDGRDSRAALQAARWAKDADIPIVIDIDQIYDGTTHTLLSIVDYLISAEDFALRTTNSRDPETAIKVLADRYQAPITGITLGESGAIFSHKGNLIKSKAFKAPVVDTTGAGDVFHGAFIFGILEGWSLEKTITFSHAVAALKCTKIGARTGIPDLEATIQFLKSHGD